jgi:hypothetical protein
MESASLSSKLLNQFKLFSQKEKSVITTPNISPNNAKYYLLSFILILLIALYIHFGIDDIKTQLIRFVENIWLNAHLTRTGELASIYVPKNFSFFSGNVEPLM